MKNCKYRKDCDEYFSIRGQWLEWPCSWENRDNTEGCSLYQKLRREEEEYERGPGVALQR